MLRNNSNDLILLKMRSSEIQWNSPWDVHIIGALVSALNK